MPLGKPKRPRQFGRTWNPKTPRHSIGVIVGRLHVSTSDDEVRSIIQSRVDIVRMKNPVGWTPAIVKQCLDFAILAHRANQDLFRRVMGGVR